MKMAHSIVYAHPEMYAGWPANHGAWQWGDEFLVGFMRGPYAERGMHNIGLPFEKLLARSMDGGQTWAVEQPNVDFEFDQTQIIREAPPFCLSSSMIMRVCGIYDHGGDDGSSSGAFYLSRDRGLIWAGPFSFNGIEFAEGMINTSRTRTLGDLVFMTSGLERIWGSDYAFVAQHDGEEFHRIGVICDDNARAVMPAVAEIDGRLIAVLRRRKSGVREGWIDAFVSDDRGYSWRFASRVGITGSSNGNPAALIGLGDGRLLCVFGNRDEGSMIGALSDDRGATWGHFVVRKSESDCVDIGYPQLFIRSDGVPVCVYYWASRDNPAQHIAATAIDIT